MRILIVHRELPFPADNGGKLRAAHVARYLALHHEAVLVHFSDTVGREFAERELFKDYRVELAPRPTPIHRRIFSGVPSEVIDLDCAKMKRTIAEVVARHDPQVMLTSEPALTPYFTPYSKCVCVLDYLMVQTLSLERLAAINRGLKRLIWKLRYQRALAFHRQIAHFFDLCLVNSQEDLDDLTIRSPGWRKLEFFPNGLDLKDYPLNLAEPSKSTLIYPGSVTYEPNRDAVGYMVEQILPRVREVVPHAELVVTGAVPKDVSVPEGPGVTYTGRVPDVRPVIASARACVVPLRSGAGGTRFKVLEAMALGTPVISTTIGAEGVAWTDNKNIAIADNAAQFAESTIQILKDDTTYNRLSKGARQLVEERYNWDALGQQLSRILLALCERKQGNHLA